MKPRNVIRVFAIAAAAVLLAGCGGHKAATATKTEPRRSSALAVKKGMTEEQVRALAGEPQVAGPRCWLYRFVLANSGNQISGSSIDGVRLCFTHGRVSLVQTSLHG